MMVSSDHARWWAAKPSAFDTLLKFNDLLARPVRAN